MPRPSFVKLILAVVLALPLLGTGPSQPDTGVIAHEWGTFTSVAGRNGESIPWAPLEGSSDLPCFVHQMGTGISFKAGIHGLVRMETPVDYFYTQTPTKVSVHVDFPAGHITEWYPKASNPNSFRSIDWADLSIRPGENPVLPSTKAPSRYFAARATDSALLMAGDENEKFLFYRGIADFKVPLLVISQGNGVQLHNSGTEAMPLAILFENQKGRVGYRISRDIKDDVLLYAPELNATLDGLRGELAEALVQAGLYPKEAAAMVETWRDSWFEEGMRIIYVMPPAAVDRVLPLKISPTPKEVRRVFVGRTEILSPWTDHTIRVAMETGDTQTLDRFGRFLEPFLAEIRARGGLAESAVATSYVQQIAAKLGGGSAPCVQ